MEIIDSRAWVVRIPPEFVGGGCLGQEGFQTVVMAQNPDEAWVKAAESDTWESLSFEVEHLIVFPKEPR